MHCDYTLYLFKNGTFLITCIDFYESANTEGNFCLLPTEEYTLHNQYTFDLVVGINSEIFSDIGIIANEVYSSLLREQNLTDWLKNGNIKPSDLTNSEVHNNFIFLLDHGMVNNSMLTKGILYSYGDALIYSGYFKKN